jgi:hypothetical protein
MPENLSFDVTVAPILQERLESLSDPHGMSPVELVGKAIGAATVPQPEFTTPVATSAVSEAPFTLPTVVNARRRLPLLSRRPRR